MPEEKKKRGRPKGSAPKPKPKKKAQEPKQEEPAEYICQICGKTVYTPEQKIYTGQTREGYKVLCRDCIRYAKQLTPYVSYHGLEALRREKETV